MPAEVLETLAQKALKVAKQARKQRKSLSGDNSYANTLAKLRAEAVNEFRELSNQSLGDTTALAELIESVFSASKSPEERSAAFRELAFSLRTTWKEKPAPAIEATAAEPDLFPSNLLTDTGRGYIVAIGRQMNACFARGLYDACAVMMRRLVEISIIEAYEGRNADAAIRGADGNYLQLSGLVARTVAETVFRPTRNCKIYLPQLRDVGDLSAHGRHYIAQRGDIERMRLPCRVVVEELLRHARLLN
jgi:hypothetical protein